MTCSFATTVSIASTTNDAPGGTSRSALAAQ